MPDRDYRMVGISKAPDDPGEKEKWVKDMMRVQVALWIEGGAECEMCAHKYESVDDFLDKSPRYGGVGKFVCGDCWFLYEQLVPKPVDKEL